MKCSNGHYKHPQLFAPTQRRRAEKGQRALCMSCQKKIREEAEFIRTGGKKEKGKRGSAWRDGGYDRMLFVGTKF
jgi:hypothetical protein